MADVPPVVEDSARDVRDRMYRDEASDSHASVCLVGTARLSLHQRCMNDLRAVLKSKAIGVHLGVSMSGSPLRNAASRPGLADRRTLARAIVD